MIFIGGISSGMKQIEYMKTVICSRCGAYGRYQVFRKVHGRHIVFPVHGDIEWPPQTLSSPAAPNHDNLPPGTKDSYTHPTTPSAGLRRRPHLLN